MVRYPCFVVLFGLAASCGSASPARPVPSVVSPDPVQREGLVRCSVVLDLGGEETVLHGWGRDDVEALAHGRLAEELLRDHVIHTQYWIWVMEHMADPHADPSAFQHRLSNSHAPARAVADCQAASNLPVASRVQARFGLHSAQAESPSAAVAVETARRVACQSQWGQGFVELFSTLRSADHSVRGDFIAAAEGDIIHDLVSCMTGEDFVLEAADESRAESTEGVSFCQVTLAVGLRTRFLGQALGLDPSRALHAASTRATEVALARTDHEIAQALARGDSADRSAHLFGAIAKGVYASLFEAAAGTPLARCAPALEERATWTPGDGLCPAPDQAQAPGALCRGVAESLASEGDPSIASAALDDRGRMVIHARGEVQRCTADCLSEFQITSQGSFVDTHWSRCGTEAEARATVQRGIDSRNVRELLHCADADMVGALAQRMLGDPDRLFNGLSRLDVVEHITAANSDGAVRLGIRDSFR